MRDGDVFVGGVLSAGSLGHWRASCMVGVRAGAEVRASPRLAFTIIVYL